MVACLIGFCNFSSGMYFLMHESQMVCPLLAEWKERPI